MQVILGCSGSPVLTAFQDAPPSVPHKDPPATPPGSRVKHAWCFRVYCERPNIKICYPIIDRAPASTAIIALKDSFLKDNRIKGAWYMGGVYRENSNV